MTASDRFELFSFWRTSATYRVRVAFNLKGVAPREHNVNLDAGEQRSEAFLKVNPMGAIPALVDHGPGQSSAPLTQRRRPRSHVERGHRLAALEREARLLGCPRVDAARARAVASGR